MSRIYAFALRSAFSPDDNELELQSPTGQDGSTGLTGPKKKLE